MKPATRNRMVNEWELVLKREFSNSAEDKLFSCPIGPIPDDSTMRIVDGELWINREEMLAIFDPVISKIITLVQEQIDMVAANDGRVLPISVRHYYRLVVETLLIEINRLFSLPVASANRITLNSDLKRN